MNRVIQELESVDWNSIRKTVDTKGYDIIPSVLSALQCGELISSYTDPTRYRKTVSMERYRFGRGEYKYFTYPLGDLITGIRQKVYAELVSVANGWMNNLNVDVTYPPTHNEFIKTCHGHGQEKATVLILKYGEGGFNTLHQDLYGEVYFPFQIVLFLNEPDLEYSGGEFVLTEQIPRAQSKAIVLKPRRGDLLIFTTNFRPIKGTRGYYKATMKHGVSEVRKGERHTLGIIFHDAAT